jgi:hypothetical protein
MFDFSTVTKQVVVTFACVLTLGLVSRPTRAEDRRVELASACLAARGDAAKMVEAQKALRTANKVPDGVAADVEKAEKAVRDATEKRDKAKKDLKEAKAANRDAAAKASQSADEELNKKQAELLTAQSKLTEATGRANATTGLSDCQTLTTNICSEAAQGKLAATAPDFLTANGGANAKACVKAQLVGQTAAPAAVGAEIVRSIAQVVVTKAQAAGWQLLVSELKKKAQCGEAGTKFPRTCKVLGSLSIKDLVSSPDVLVSAVVTDLLKDIDSPVLAALGDKAGGNVAALALVDAATAWAQSHDRGLAKAMERAVKNYIRNNAVGSCSSAKTVPEKYAYVVGMCLLQQAGSGLSKCDTSALIDECSARDADTAAKLGRLWDLTLTAFDTVNKAQPIDWVNLAFALGREQLDTTNHGQAADAYFDGSKDLASGLATKDWVMATSGAVQVLATLETGLDAKEASNKAAYKAAIDLVKVLAAIGNYALTFDTKANPDPAAAATAREKIITELVDRFVSRSERDGVVVSLGGTLGLVAGARVGRQDGKAKGEFASPVQLTLGVGLQTYSKPTDDGGFHMMFSALDLGNYVSMNGSGALTVDTPELKSALAPGLALGYWFTLRETPLHLAAQASYAPFHGADGNPTFQAGLTLGIYVPLVDFN